MYFKKCPQLIYGMILITSLINSDISSQINDLQDVTDILNSYVEDYQRDIMLTKEVTFGIKVDAKFWHIKARPKTDSTEAKVGLYKGKPSEPTFYFYTDIQTLRKIDKGELNALTGAAKAFDTDHAPFDMDVMEGFTPNQDFMGILFSVLFHFWTRGTPEVIPYGIDFTRFTHGAQASIFYYQTGFRSGYVAVKKGQHANKDENSKSNPFPTLLIAIKGEGIMVIDGKKSTFKAGQAILIPAGVSHEFLNPDHDAPLECILLMFGKGA